MNLHTLVDLALDEDLGPGGVCLTTMNTIPASALGVGRMLAKQPLVMCGHEAAAAVFARVDHRFGGRTLYEVLVKDGVAVDDRTYVANISGPLRNIIIGERVALNLVMRLCGIATQTASIVSAAKGSPTRVVDTRKTTWLHRALEKYAVTCGGGKNHRMGLYDGVMVKDNHITAVGGLKEAVNRVRANVHHLIRIEVEASSLDEVKEALATDADVILLDNMSDDLLKASISIARATRAVVLEASGNMDAQRISRIKDFGLDVISVGGLIHQARWADLSLKVQ